jgi:hypothetical protein
MYSDVILNPVKSSRQAGLTSIRITVDQRPDGSFARLRMTLSVIDRFTQASNGLLGVSG